MVANDDFVRLKTRDDDDDGSAFRECDAEDDDELLEEEEEEEKEETRKARRGQGLENTANECEKIFETSYAWQKSPGRARDIDKKHARLPRKRRSILQSVEKAVDSTDDLMQRVVSLALRHAESARRGRTLRMRAELLEKMCEEGLLRQHQRKDGIAVCRLLMLLVGVSRRCRRCVFFDRIGAPKKNTPRFALEVKVK